MKGPEDLEDGLDSSLYDFKNAIIETEYYASKFGIKEYNSDISA